MLVDDAIAAPPVRIESAEVPIDRDLAISVRGVGKMYRIYDRPQDRLKQMIFRGRRMYGREFWALRGVSFDMHKGETLGIIGRNGSGKSTLLQIIAGTLAPTEGEVMVKGRVAALLELGSGFNPEFTGRENVFLNGAILGFSRDEMAARFDEIVAFADIGEFIDQPVKTYSSGMYVRLAFAVQACVEPDILIVDEALAVGDIFFRQKCYRRIEALRDRGTAIILVSHSMTDIEQFCQQAILLHYSKVLFQGYAPEAVKHYYLLDQDERAPLVAPPRRHDSEFEPAAYGDALDWPHEAAWRDLSNAAQVSNGWARCSAVAVCNSMGQPARTFQQGEMASFFYEFELLVDIEIPIGGITIQNDRGVIVHGKNSLQYDSPVPELVRCGSHIRFRQDIALELALGEYSFEIGLAAIARDDYRYREQYAHDELYAKIIRLCHVPVAGGFSVGWRHSGVSHHLLHHGVANLHGSCLIAVPSAQPS